MAEPQQALLHWSPFKTCRKTQRFNSTHPETAGAFSSKYNHPMSQTNQVIEISIKSANVNERQKKDMSVI